MVFGCIGFVCLFLVGGWVYAPREGGGCCKNCVQTMAFLGRQGFCLELNACKCV